MKPISEQKKIIQATTGPWVKSLIICEVYGNTAIPEGFRRWLNNRVMIAAVRNEYPNLLQWAEKARVVVGEYLELNRLVPSPPAERAAKIEMLEQLLAELPE